MNPSMGGSHLISLLDQCVVDWGICLIIDFSLPTWQLACEVSSDVIVLTTANIHTYPDGGYQIPRPSTQYTA
jgi:hypothetical protein